MRHYSELCYRFYNIERRAQTVSFLTASKSPCILSGGGDGDYLPAHPPVGAGLPRAAVGTKTPSASGWCLISLSLEYLIEGAEYSSGIALQRHIAVAAARENRGGVLERALHLQRGLRSCLLVESWANSRRRIPPPHQNAWNSR